MSHSKLVHPSDCLLRFQAAAPTHLHFPLYFLYAIINAAIAAKYDEDNLTLKKAADDDDLIPNNAADEKNTSFVPVMAAGKKLYAMFTFHQAFVFSHCNSFYLIDQIKSN